MDEDQQQNHPIYRIATEAEQPSKKIIAKAKRDIARNWHKFWERRGLDPNHVGVENGFKPKPRGRPRKNAAGDDSDGGRDDGGDDLPSVSEAAMD